MDILAVTDNLGNTGGAEISAQTIIRGLSHHTEVDEITVIGVESTDESRLDFGNANVVAVTPPERVQNLPVLAADLVVERLLAREIRAKSETVDVIHAHHRQSTLALSHVDTSSSTVTTIRDFWPTCPISTYNINGESCTGCGDRLDDCVTHNELVKFSEIGTKAYLLAKRRHQQPVISSVDCAVFIAQHIRERISESIDFPEETEVIHNPVSIEDEIEPIPGSSPTFVTASSLTRSKGIETAIRAVGQITDSFPSCRLIIFGDGPERDRLETIAEESAPDLIEFRGRVPSDEVYQTMAGATATIFPSIWEEPFGRITVESMMIGTPVIGSDVGGIAEIIDDGKTGLLFPPDRPALLADKLRMVIEDDELNEQLTRNGKDQSNRFQPERITEKYLELYHRITD